MSDIEFTNLFSKLTQSKAQINRVGLRETLHNFGLLAIDEQLIAGRRIFVSAQNAKDSSSFHADKQLYGFVSDEARDMVLTLEHLTV
jgi:hypothetical protein